jgi:hypothetical protein
MHVVGKFLSSKITFNNKKILKAGAENFGKLVQASS